MVGFSAGKDSLAVLDLCAKTFKKVHPVFFYLVPGLEVIEVIHRWAQQRYGVEVIQIPSTSLITAKKHGTFCNPLAALEKAPDEIPLKMRLAYGLDMVGCHLCATGMKDADGFQRRQFFGNIRDGKDPFWNRVIHPIRSWTKKDVLDYLKVNDIPLPDSEPGAVTSGVGLEHNCLNWLHDKHPEDFKKLCKLFPYAEAAIKRREWFGI
ncbi:MAG TPA: phosphoadenosine phosphosulfate reductase family protein [Verrucomicrobiae bacterium]|nr:phosphoadenosine phosphosulfate reductase family protein [Verrucomicrobiae bacterium]